MNELEDLLAAARRLARDRIAPVARELDEVGWVESTWADLCELGLPGMCLPTEYGGLGLPYSAYLAVTAEISRVSAVAGLMPALNVLVGRAILRSGGRQLQERYLPRLAGGDSKACWAFTEPATGSDPRAITTRAVPAPTGGWTINGDKTFISHSGAADVAVVFAQLDGRLTAFIGSTRAGFHPGKRASLLGFAGADTGDVHLEDMHVDDVIGEPGEGFAVLLASEAEAKLRAGAICLGIAEHCCDDAVRYATSREHRGTSIGERFQTIQWLVAECEARTEAIRSLIERAGRLSDAGAASAAHAAKVKLMSSRLCREVASDAMQVHGAYGYSKDYDIEMLYRQAKMYEVVQGVSELNRVIIARDELAGGGTRS